MTIAHDKKRSRLWSRVRPVLCLAAMAGFVCTSLYAKWHPALGGEGAPSRKASGGEAQKTDPNAKGAKSKKKQAEPVKSSVLGPIPGLGKKLDYHDLARIIDAEVAKRMAAEGLKPSPRSDDSEFLRRVYLDLTGVIPSADKVEAFLKDTDAGKRAKVIDELLSDPRFGKSLGEAWSGLMMPRESNNRRLDHTPLQQWLAKEFNADVPLNKLVFDLVTATGTTEDNGAAAYFVGNATVDKMTDNVTRMFMGVQLQCAQCHNHPFTDWKQTEYWAMAAFFMKTKLTANPQMAAKKGIAPGITEMAVKGGGKKQGLPDSAKIVPAKFLQGETPNLKPSEPYRPVLAQWMTTPNNPFFAKAMVNRFWYQLFGRGLVNPVDDMHKDNPPTHPELLAAMTEQFKTSGFDTKYLVRAICNSDTYQRTSKPADGNQDDDRFLSHRVVRVMTPEQLYDSLSTLVGPAGGKKVMDKKGPLAGKKGPANPRDNFLNFFRIDEGADPREYQAGIPQALRLMNSGQSNNTGATVANSMEEGDNVPKQVIERLYLHALSRRPSAEETERLVSYVRDKGEPGPRAAYSDILWAILNSSEFAFNH
jgi:hypothetical protein